MAQVCLKNFVIVFFLIVSNFLPLFAIAQEEIPPSIKPPASYRWIEEPVINPQERSIRWGAYMKRVKEKIKSNWDLVCKQKYNDSKQAIVIFTLNKNGQLLSYYIVKSSGDSTYDEKAILSIKSSAPFESFPINCDEDTIDIQFDFTYNFYHCDSDNDSYQDNSDQYNKYLKKINDKIAKNWDPPSYVSEKNAIVLFKLGRNGELLSYKIVKTSGTKSFDEHAIIAIKLSSPFEEFPDAFKDDELNIKFNFSSSEKRINKSSNKLEAVYVFSHLTQTILWIISLFKY